MNLLDKFYSSFMQEIVSRQLANEDGETQEQAFTRYVLDLLSEAGETENAAVAFDEKALGTSKQHKINGFAAYSGGYPFSISGDIRSLPS